MKSALAAIALLLTPALAFAQLSVGSTEPFTLSLAPAYPEPGEALVVAPESTALDLSNNTFTLSVNGAQVYSGNAKPVSITLGGVGQTTRILAVLKAAGASYSQSLSLNPGAVSLIAEPAATAPALYPGKPLVPQSGNVRIVAMADLRTSPSARLDPATLAYTWTVNGTVMQAASGIGRTSIMVPSPLLYRDEQISVKVMSPGGSIMGGDSLTLTPQNATVRLYAEDPLLGILYDHALAGSYTISGAEQTFIAVPYSFALGAVNLNWFLNGNAAQSGPEITLRPDGSGAGQASLSLTASQRNQTASAALGVTFGSSSGGFFGL